MATKTRKVKKSLRRYGATVFTTIEGKLAGKALKALEHAPEVQVINLAEIKSDPALKKITLRSLAFPRFWEGTEVDLLGNVEEGLVAIYHPSMEAEEEKE